MARVKTIALRIAGGWKNGVQNKDPLNCDIDGARLWVAPDGKTLYCNQVHEQ